jgi:hypothetical protein
MKKLGLLALPLAALVFSACVGTTALGVLDESVPEESRCPLEIRNNLAVIVYDNQPVEWVSALTANKITISLPPGEHSFMVRYYVTRNTGYNQSETYPVTETISQEFLPGHSYRIYRQNIWLLLFTITNIKIKDVTPRTKGNF